MELILTHHIGGHHFCGTILTVACTGRYPATCPVEPGLSSKHGKSTLRDYLDYFLHNLISIDVYIVVKFFIMKNFKNSGYVHKMFDDLAADYDMMNNIISFGRHKTVKKTVINNVPVKTGDNILDVCTGTGDFPLFVSKKFGDSVKITAVDFSDKMLEIAKTRNKNNNNVEFINADALNLPFADETFDVAFISFGLRNLEDLRRGIVELKRVVKKGGYVVNLDMGKPKGFIGCIFRLYFFGIVPLLGKLFHGSSEPYVYLPESCESFPSQEELAGIFHELGFSDVKNYNFAFGALAQQVAKV